MNLPITDFFLLVPRADVGRFVVASLVSFKDGLRSALCLFQMRKRVNRNDSVTVQKSWGKGSVQGSECKLQASHS